MSHIGDNGDSYIGYFSETWPKVYPPDPFWITHPLKNRGHGLFPFYETSMTYLDTTGNPISLSHTYPDGSPPVSLWTFCQKKNAFKNSVSEIDLDQ